MKKNTTDKGEFSFEEQNSLDEQDDRNQNSINASAKESFARAYYLQIQKVEAILLSEFINSIKLKLRPEDYVTKKNDENLRLNEYVFIFKVVLNEQEWKIRKRFSDFQNLDKQMRKLAEDTGINEQQLYPIPKVEGSQNIQQMFDLFFLYLTQCIQFPVLEKNEIFQEFLEISAINHQGHKKFKECFMVKKAGGRTNESRCVRCGVFWGRWNKRYFCITSDGVSISKGRSQNECQIREMIMFDYDFYVNYGLQETGYQRGIRLNSSNRKLTLEAPTLFLFFDFLMGLKEAIEESPYLGTHRFASFSPLRQKNNCKWYVDGENYFKDVYKYIKRAQSEIFITDWWLSPQFYLVRPVKGEKQSSRIDLLLQQKADEKVKVFIIVYREPKVALTIDSHYTKTCLMGQHQNIKVIRHPKTLIPFMWSHHEKMVVIDQKVGFLGGLDICYGRMDNQKHHLFDTVEEEGQGQFWPGNFFEKIQVFIQIMNRFLGIDFSNGRTKDYSNVKDFLRSEIDRRKDPRLPWHDIAMRVVGDVVIDMSRHFIQYWNFALADIELKRAKENKFVLRMRQNESVDSKRKSDRESGFLNKIKQKWKKFRESSILGDSKKNGADDEPEQEEQKQDLQQNLIDENQEALYDQDAIATSKSHLSFQKQNQNDLYFNQLMRQSQISHTAQTRGQEKSFLSNQSKIQFFDKQSHPNAIVINEKVEEENQTDQSQLIYIQKLESNESKKSQQNNFNQISSSSPVVLQSHQSNRVLQSAFPILQSKTSDQITPVSEIQQVNRIRSHSTDNLKTDVLEQQFLDLLNDVRRIKDEDASKGYYESQDQKNNEDNSKAVKKRKKSDDSDSSVENVDEEQQDIILDNKKIIHTVKGKSDCQMVRSSSLWSCGVKETECSIHIAYIQLIGQAQHFIYIENQFFISGTAGDPVKNNIAQALVSRIKQAHQNNEQFRIIVVVPLLPGFEGEIDGNSGVLKIQLHWEYQTICRGGNSIYEILENENIPNPDKYISFYGLRTHAQKAGQDPVTEIVYVHSKLMIVDDRIVIMGSANINDRSMKGSRDSEIAMVIEDKEYITTVMGGEQHQSSKFAYTLRQSLFQEHFGLSEKELVDPLDNDFFEKIQTNSKKNTWIYREIFRCYPDDNIKVSSDYEEFKKKKNLALYANLKDQITGYAVEFPKRFLENEDLRLKRSQKEFYCPDINFT
ncbi:hypothetical protein ABPG74_008455 [Tetrahymena malaccensis]